MSAEPRELRIEPGNPDEPAVAELLRRSEEYAHSLYPPEGVHMLPSEELRSASVRFLVARNGPADAVVGCGAVVLDDGSSAEIKRMFVDPAARGRGIGAELLRALEQAAGAEGVTVVRLETGPSQPEALGLYRRFGYRERGPFGAYRADDHSVFMEKRLSDD